MPSPIAHSAMGYAIYQLTRSSNSQQEPKWFFGPIPSFLLMTIVLSLLPDLDAIPGLLLGNLKQFHNNLTHSLVLGVVIALFTGGIVWLKQKFGFWRWFIIVLLCYNMHIVMDFFTVGGRGVMIFWPFSSERYDSAVKLFYGLRWSDGLISARHLWTIVTEAVFALLLGFIVHLLQKLNSSLQLSSWNSWRKWRPDLE